MKKFLFAILFTLIGFVSFAQTDSCSYNNVYANDTFYKARNGVVYDTGIVSMELHIDTSYTATDSPDGTYFYRFTGKGYTGETERCGAIEVIR